jgi:hypothetical protein
MYPAGAFYSLLSNNPYPNSSGFYFLGKYYEIVSAFGWR